MCIRDRNTSEPQLNALPTACLRPVHARRSGCGSEVFFRAGRGAELPPSPARFSGCSALLFSVTAFELYLSYHPRRRLSSRRRVRPRAQSAFRDRIAVLYNKTTWKSRCHSPIIKMYETIFYPTLEGKSVSYTHLDVYKRQAQPPLPTPAARTSRCPRRRSAAQAGTPGSHGGSDP